MTVPVRYLTAGDQPAAGYWDQGLLADLFADELATPPGWPAFDVVVDAGLPDEGGCVVIVPASHNLDRVQVLNRMLAGLDWAVVLLTNNEEGKFPVEQLRHPHLRVWVQSPGPAQIAAVAGHRFLPYGYPPACRPTIGELPDPNGRSWDAAFLGQVTHERRVDAVAALEHVEHTALVTSDRFAGGVNYGAYIATLLSSRTVLCPSGPVAVDSFRLWETLEAGAVPIVDTRNPAGARFPWAQVLGELPPWPTVTEWAEAPRLIELAARDWPASTNRVSAWWKRWKRTLACRLADDVADLSCASPNSWPVSMREHVTVLVTMSPIPSHPSLAVLTETVETVWADPALADCEILLTIDGVRGEQQDRAEDYADAVQALLWRCHHDPRWRNVVPVLADDHQHQANMVRAALPLVRTPLVLFIEHDTPLVGRVPWVDMAAAVQSGDLDVVRLHYDRAIHPEHRYLMLDRDPVHVSGLRVVRTRQWSQRPHLASTDWYRETIDRFPASSRTMIEDRLYTDIVNGEWEDNRVAIYAPPVDMQRSRHLDGRGDDPKFGMVFW